MTDFSDEAIKKRCPHCDLKSFAYRVFLEKTREFSIICDVHPLVEGHILIIPKKHISCIGEFNADLLKEFRKLNTKVSKFLSVEYGSVASFEHGKIGQTVYHSHVHYLPFSGEPIQIIPEGKKYLTELKDIDHLAGLFRKEGQYLFFKIGAKMWSVDVKLGVPRFFRDRFAEALGNPDRGNWKAMHGDKMLMSVANKEIEKLKQRWERYFT